MRYVRDRVYKFLFMCLELTKA